MNRKQFLMTIVACALSAMTTPLSAQVAAPTIAWEKDPQIAWKAAISRERSLLVFVSANWCGPCQKMKRDTWADSEVTKLVHEQFVPLYLDGDKYAELVESLNVHAFPTTLIVNPDGRIVHEMTGYNTAVPLRTWLKKAIDAKPTTKLAASKQKASPRSKPLELSWFRSK